MELLGNLTLSQLQTMNWERSGENRWAAAFYLTYPFELSFVVCGQLLVLHRLHALSMISSQRTWLISRRVFLTAIIAFNVVGVVGNIVSAVYFIQAAELDSEAAVAWASNSPVIASSYEREARQRKSTAGVAASVQRFYARRCLHAVPLGQAVRLLRLY